MGEVIATNSIKTKTGYRFISRFLGKQILQVSSTCQDWDTNTGHDSGPEYTNWRNATRWESEEFLRGQDR